MSGNDLWVPDKGNAAVDVFSSSGAAITQQTGGAANFSSTGVQSVAVVNSTGYSYVADASSTGATIDVFDSTGAFSARWDGSSTPAGSFGQYVLSVAADNSGDASNGDIYAADFSHSVIDKFDSSGNLVPFSGSASYISGSQLTGTPAGSFSNLHGLTVDGSGNIYVGDDAGGSNNVVDEFDATGTFVRQFTGDATPNGSFSFVTGVAVDPSTGNVYVVDEGAGVVDEFTGTGAFLDQINGVETPAGSFSDPRGVAVGPDGSVYVSDAGSHVIDVFSPDLTLPSVTTDSASNIGQQTATLNGSVNPGGVQLSDCHFEYVTLDAYNSTGYSDLSSGGSVPCSPAAGSIPGDSSDHSVSAEITGLTPGRIYHFRLVAGNTNGSTDGADQSLETTGAGFGIASFDGSVINADGSTDTQAGSHPFAATTSFAFNSIQTPGGDFAPDGQVKDINVNLPAGFIGNPTGIAQCAQADLVYDGSSPDLTDCPLGSQVGVLTVKLTGFGSTITVPVFNMTPPPGEPAQFGAEIIFTNLYIDAHVRSGGDYGLTASLSDISTLAPLTSSSLTFWGVPADPAHNALRGALCTGDPSNLANCTGGGNAPDSAPQPFLTLPTSCVGPQTTTMTADTWQNPGAFTTTSFVSHDNSGNPVGTTGCNRLQFQPTISVQPDTTAADSPSGLDVDLHIPQAGLEDPSGLAAADLKTAVVTLPAGTSVNPSSAQGLGACSPAQIALSSPDPASCPASSKIGTVEIDTPLLSHPIDGGVYLAQQTDNPFGSLLAMYIAVDDPQTGIVIKLAGHIVANPTTGQLQTTFSDNPQLPFTDLKLDLFGGPRAPLATPESCGTYSTTSDLTPWASGVADAAPGDSFSLDSGCVTGFAPKMTAGVTDPQAGRFSPFVLSVSRSDTDENLSGLSVKLPPGMLAKLAGVQECSGSQLASISSQPGTAAEQIAHPSCPSASQVGTVETGAGVGPDPLFVPGKVYLTGPYRGAPYGLAVVVPVLAGPFDLGTVVVRQALHVDPTTAQVTDVSDPFPTILDGIPLRIRRVDVVLNRPNFTVTPTSCDVMAVSGTVTSTQGSSATLSSRFQVGGCAGLGFSPTLRMSLTGRGRTKSGDHPNLVSTLTQKAGQANISSVRVALPLSLALDPNNSESVCAFATAQAVHGGAVGCPTSTIVGRARAITPLLSEPLSGNVYLVQGIRISHGVQIRTLPSLLIPLRGQIALDLRAQTSVSHGKLATTFPTIPDAAVSKFTLTINGGKKGILVITGRGRSICGKPQVTDASLIAQSGRAEYPDVKMSTPCRAPRKRHKHKK